MNRSLLNLIAAATAGLVALAGLPSARAADQSMAYGDIYNYTGHTLKLVSTEGSTDLHEGDFAPPKEMPPGSHHTFKYARWGNTFPKAVFKYAIGDSGIYILCWVGVNGPGGTHMGADFNGSSKSDYICEFGWSRADNKFNPGPLYILGKR